MSGDRVRGMRDHDEIEKLENERREALERGDAARVELLDAQLSAARTGE